MSKNKLWVVVNKIPTDQELYEIIVKYVRNYNPDTLECNTLGKYPLPNLDNLEFHKVSKIKEEINDDVLPNAVLIDNIYYGRNMINVWFPTAFCTQDCTLEVNKELVKEAEIQWNTIAKALINSLPDNHYIFGTQINF